MHSLAQLEGEVSRVTMMMMVVVVMSAIERVRLFGLFVPTLVPLVVVLVAYRMEPGVLHAAVNVPLASVLL